MLLNNGCPIGHFSSIWLTKICLGQPISCTFSVERTVLHENFMVVKFYGLPLSRLDEKLLGF